MWSALWRDLRSLFWRPSHPSRFRRKRRQSLPKNPLAGFTFETLPREVAIIIVAKAKIDAVEASAIAKMFSEYHELTDEEVQAAMLLIAAGRWSDL